MAPKKTTELEQIAESSLGLDALLNNELPEAKRILALDGDSPFSLLGLGLTSFLAAALGQEDEGLYSALAILAKAEVAATRESGLKRDKSEPLSIYPIGSEYKVLIADSVICQALVHVLTESYLEFMKAVYKLNRSYKGYGVIYKIVFPAGVNEDDSLASIYNTLNANYLGKKNAVASTPSVVEGSFFSSWSKKRDLQPLRQSSSSATLPSLANLPINDESEGSSSGMTISMPNSMPPSLTSSKTHLPLSNGDSSNDLEVIPAAAWEGDAISTMVISGAAFGTGVFGLIFSLLPPKLRKLISWFGFSNSNRSVALKLLHVAAGTGNDVHGYFSSLALLTYYGVVLLMSGWQSEEAYIVAAFTSVLERVETRFPNGTLWVLNRAKINRMTGNTKAAIEILETALEKTSTFREADSLLVFELSWCYLSDGQWLKAANSFINMREKNNWSHATYVFIAAGALLDQPRADRTPEVEKRIDDLMNELPSLFGLKRLLGEPPSTEIFISRKVQTYKAKHARWIASGRISATSKYWEVIRVSPASELGLFWNTNGRAKAAAVQSQIDHLISFSPVPKFGPSAPSTSTASSPAPSPSLSLSPQQSTTSLSTTASTRALYDLDTIEEIETRGLLLGALYRSLGELEISRSFLQAVMAKENVIKEETWVPPFATFELAVVECQVGDREELRVGKGTKAGAIEWKKYAAKADLLLDAVFAKGEYDLKSRLESRVQMLRDEIGNKRAKLASVV